MRIDICLPVHNEERILESNARRLLRFCRDQEFDFSWRIILVINGSSDESAAIGRRLAGSEAEIDVVILDAPGKGKALQSYWLESRADIVAFMDCDLATELESLSGLLRPLLARSAELVIGSRLLRGSTVSRSAVREVMSRSYNALSKSILGHRFSDAQCGFKAMRRETFLALSPLIRDGRWFFDTELIVWAKALNKRVAEVPISWQEGRAGSRPSQIRIISDSLYFLKNLLYLKRRLRAFDRQKGLG